MRGYRGECELFSPRTERFCYFYGSGSLGYERCIWISCRGAMVGWIDSGVTRTRARQLTMLLSSRRSQADRSGQGYHRLCHLCLPLRCLYRGGKKKAGLGNVADTLGSRPPRSEASETSGAYHSRRTALLSQPRLSLHIAC